MVVDFILERQSVGIQRLVSDGVYSAAYPLHDVSSFTIYSFVFYFMYEKSITAQ